MCGILGVVANNPVNQLLYDGLLVLQHRGQDAAGIVTAEGPMFHIHKGVASARRLPPRTCARSLATHDRPHASRRRLGAFCRGTRRSTSIALRIVGEERQPHQHRSSEATLPTDLRHAIPTRSELLLTCSRTTAEASPTQSTRHVFKAVAVGLAAFAAPTPGRDDRGLRAPAFATLRDRPLVLRSRETAQAGNTVSSRAGSRRAGFELVRTSAPVSDLHRPRLPFFSQMCPNPRVPAYSRSCISPRRIPSSTHPVTKRARMGRASLTRCREYSHPTSTSSSNSRSSRSVRRSALEAAQPASREGFIRPLYRPTFIMPGQSCGRIGPAKLNAISMGREKRAALR